MSQGYSPIWVRLDPARCKGARAGTSEGVMNPNMTIWMVSGSEEEL